MKYPAELYRSSPRPYRGLAELEYPFHDRTVTITHCGRICLGKRKINFSQVFAGQNVGIKEVADRIWLVTFMHYDLGFFDHETCPLEPVDNPFEPKVLPMSPVQTVTYATGIDLRETGRGDRIRTCDILLPKQARYRAALHPEGRILPSRRPLGSLPRSPADRGDCDGPPARLR
jgi:hypothetical protein